MAIIIRRMCYCFSLSRGSYSLYCNKLSVHNSGGCGCGGGGGRGDGGVGGGGGGGGGG